MEDNEVWFRVHLSEGLDLKVWFTQDEAGQITLTDVYTMPHMVTFDPSPFYYQYVDPATQLEHVLPLEEYLLRIAYASSAGKKKLVDIAH